MFTKFLTVLLLVDLALDSILCQQCDVVIANHADYKKEIRSEVANALYDFTLHNNASSSMSEQVLQCNVRSYWRSILEEIREEMKKQVNDLREEMKLLLQPGHTPSHPADSCADIWEYNNQLDIVGSKFNNKIPTGCTVTWPRHVVESLEHGWKWLNLTRQIILTSVRALSHDKLILTNAQL